RGGYPGVDLRSFRVAFQICDYVQYQRVFRKPLSLRLEYSRCFLQLAALLKHAPKAACILIPPPDQNEPDKDQYPRGIFLKPFYGFGAFPNEIDVHGPEHAKSDEFTKIESR